MPPPIEPPDPLVTASLLVVLSQPTLRWENNTVIDSADKDRVLVFDISDSAWLVKTGGTYLIDRDSFASLVGARDARADGSYLASNGARYVLRATSHDGARWALAVRVASAA